MTKGFSFKLQFRPKDIAPYAERYLQNLRPKDQAAKQAFEMELGLKPHTHGYLSRDAFLAICNWKTPRTRKHCRKNSVDYIMEITTTALSTPSERLRIEVLTLLHGVQWPTASAILHFTHKEPYPILDFRALEALGVRRDSLSYDFALWWDYTQFCRNLADQEGVSMRTLDRALWQFSKETNISD